MLETDGHFREKLQAANAEDIKVRLGASQVGRGRGGRVHARRTESRNGVDSLKGPQNVGLSIVAEGAGSVTRCVTAPRGASVSPSVKPRVRTRTCMTGLG